MARRNRRFIDNANQIRLGLDFAGAILDDIQRQSDEEFSVAILQKAIKSLKLPPCDPDLTDDLYISDTKAKLQLNHLGDSTIRLIHEVINYSALVEEFIKDYAKETNDQGFPKKLRSFFFHEYKKLYVEQGLIGDPLFSGVRDAVSALIPDPKLKCAAQSILVHLFLICDLFMRPEENAAT